MQYQQFQTYRPRLRLQITPIVKKIIFISAGIFILQFITQIFTKGIDPITTLLAINPIWIKKGAIWQFVTYIFTHGSFMHLFFNMFVLFMFGMELERLWGRKEFLKYYLITGVIAGLCSFLFMPAVTVGASGAIYGLLIAYGLTFPNRLIYLYFLIPIKAKYLAILFGIIELLPALNGLITGNTGHIAHFAHLGGLAAGFVYLKIKNKTDKERRFKQKVVDLDDFINKKRANQNIDPILDKIMKNGIDSLTKEEKKRLIDAGHYFRNFNHRI